MPVVVAVGVPVPALPALSYRVPDGMEVPPVGGRVRVPLGERVVTGCVVGGPGDRDGDPAAAVPPARLRDLLESLDQESYLPRHVVGLALWVAEYYACGAGESLAAALPPLALSASGRGGFRTERVVRLTPAGRDALLAGTAGRLGPKQRVALQRLAGVPTGLGTARLREAGVAGSTVARLRERGLVTLDARRIDRDPFASEGRAAPESAAGVGVDREPTAEQRAALDTLGGLAAEHAFHVALLHGVTGSGKTEVYRRLARRVTADGRRVLVLVPEIALTPAVADTFRRAFGERVAIQHSGLSPGARHDQWHRIRRGEMDVVVGTRSAVFAPLDELGLVVVDEEHDTFLQAGGESPLPRAERRDRAGATSRRPGRARFRHAVPRDVPPCAARPVPLRGIDRTGSPAPASRGAGRRHARRAGERGGGGCGQPAARCGAAGDAGARRAGADPVEPSRLRARPCSAGNAGEPSSARTAASR